MQADSLQARARMDVSRETSARSRSSGERVIVDVAVVGCGLAGLVVAAGLETDRTGRGQCDWLLLEASDRLGGRLCSSREGVDLGGALLTQPERPTVAALLRRLRVSTFPQPDDPASARVVDGCYALVDALRAELQIEAPGDVDRRSANFSRLRTSFPIVACDFQQLEDGTATALLTSSCSTTICARHVVFACPPQLITRHIAFEPGLPPGRWKAMCETHAYLANATTVALIYPERRWPLCASNVALRQGEGRPAFKAYDGTNAWLTSAALTFLAIADEQSDTDLAAQCIAQMNEHWQASGYASLVAQADLGSFTRLAVQRWTSSPSWVSDLESSDESTADAVSGAACERPRPCAVLSAGPEWGGVLHFCGSETHDSHTGLIEGAICSAARVLEEDLLPLLLAE